MQNFPLISIVTPNYNGAEYLEETILSVLGQDYPNLEYIIIDGGSTDESINIIKKYEDKLTYWVSEKDKGLYDAIQKGFTKSSGEIMAWINSDDMYHKRAFLTVAEIFSLFPQVNWLQGNPTTFDEFGRTIFTYDLKRWSKFDYYLYNYGWIQQESIFWRRALWVKSGEKVGNNLRLAGDLDLWLRFFRYEKLYVTTALVGGFRQRSKNQLSLDHMSSYIQEADKQIKVEVLSEGDRKIVWRFNVLSRLVNFLNKTKVVNFNPILDWFRARYFDYPPTVDFDRMNQRFKI